MVKSIFQQSPLDNALADIEATDAAMPDIGPLDLPAIAAPSVPVVSNRARPGKGAEIGPVPLPANLKPIFVEASKKYQVPVNVIMALAEQESRYNSQALGVQTQWGRAKGVMQYLDDTAARLGINPYDPNQSIPAAAKQIRERLDKGYSMADAVKEHFAGTDRQKWGVKTARYGIEVLGRAARLKRELAPEFGPWYAPGAVDAPVSSRTPTAEEIAVATGAMGQRQPLDTGLASTIRNPNAMRSIVARRDSELQRLPGESGLSEPSRPAPTLGNALKGAAMAGKEAFRQVGQGVRMKFEDTAGSFIDDWVEKRMPDAPGLSLKQQRALFGKTNTERDYARSAGRAQDAKPQFESWWADAAYGGLQSIIQTAPGIAAGVVAGPGVGLAILGGQTEAQSYAKYRERGASPGMALLGGAGEGLVEAGTEMLPMGWLADRFGKVGFTKFLSQYLLREMPTEQAATFMQDAIDTAIANPDKSWGDFWAERADAAGKTAVATLMQTGAFAGVNAAIARVAQEDMAEARAESDQSQAATPVAQPPAAVAPPAAPPPPPSGPLGRAMQHAPAPAPMSIDVPVPVESDAPARPMTLVAAGIETPVQFIGQTEDAVWVKAPGGEELQIPLSEIEAGNAQLVDPAAVKQSLTAQPPSTVAETVKVAAADPAPVEAPEAPAANPAAARDETIDPQTGEIAPAGEMPATADQPVVAPASRPKAPVRPDPAADIGRKSEAELRDRLRYLADQAKTNNGWTKPLLAERKRVTAAIDAIAAPASPIAAAEAQAATSPLNDLPEPTDAQKEAGNYAKGHVAIGGLDVSIENPAGTSRRPEWPPLKHTYGYVKRSEGADGDHVDVFLGPKADDATNPVFIVDQINEDGSFDEHKVMVGFPDKGAARRGYLANYEKGWAGLGDITPMPFDQFQQWVKDPAQTLRPAGTKVAAALASAPAAVPVADADDVSDRQDALAVVDANNMVRRATAPAAERAAFRAGAANELGVPSRDSGAPITADNTAHPEAFAAGAKAARKEMSSRSKPKFDARRAISAAALPKGYKLIERDGHIVFQSANGGVGDGGDVTLGPVGSVTQGQIDKAVQEARDDHEILLPNERQSLEAYQPTDADEQAVRAAMLERGRTDGSEAQEAMLLRALGAGETAEKPAPPAPSVEPLSDPEKLPAREAKVSPGIATPMPSTQQDSKADPFAANKLFTADKVEAARALLRSKMGNLNSGVDPEALVAGMTIAGAYIEAGVRGFADYAKAMREDFGNRITPYLLSFWEGARNYPGLDTNGMSTPDESRALHTALLAEGLPVEEAGALGSEVARPSKAAKPKSTGAARTLRDDWNVEHIDGYTPIEGGKNRDTDYGLIGGVKDAFLSDTTAYLRAVSSTLVPAGFAPHAGRNGKPGNPVAKNEGGVAVSGDVGLSLRHEDTGVNVWVHIGASAMRGAVPTSKSGVSILYRVSQKDGDKFASQGVNRWAPVDLTAADLAQLIEREAGGTTPELARDHVRESQPVGQGGDRGGVSPVQDGRGVGDDTAARPDTGVLETGQPADVGQPASAGPDGEAGVRGAGTDVAPERRAVEGGDAGDGRARTGGARGAAAGAGKPAGTDGGVDLFRDTPKKVQSDSIVASPARSGPGNFHIANPLEIVGGGPVARFDRNRQAIETYNAIREEARAATAEEQRVLAGYTGWGSFGQELFQGTWDRPMPKEAWAERDRWLRDQMGKEEWQSAQRSITNAHYTDPPTVMAMWAMMQRMGFQGGRVLEPSMGIGNFFGMMPQDVAARSRLAGIELDSLTGGMAQLLYPDANIRVMGYQDSKTPDGFYDAVIGNWPFENTVISDRRYDRLSPFLHDYFFLKAIDQVRAGGLVMGITSSGTMDKKATGIRRELAKRAELVAAFRLPSGAFAEYAGTKVVTDIIILRKRAEPISLADSEGWIRSAPFQTANGEVFLNEYYAANPAHVIGKIDFGHGTTRGQPGLIVHRPDDMAAQLQRIVAAVPEGAYQAEQRVQHLSFIANHTADREGALTRTADGLFIVRGEHLAPAAEVRAYAVKDKAATAQRVEQLGKLIDMRQKYAALIDAERKGDPSTERKALSSAFTAFRKAHGALADSFGLSYLKKIDDPFYPALAALEIDGKPAAILSRTTTRAAPSIDNPTIAEAFVLERNSSVNPSLDAIAARAKVSRDEAKAELLANGAAFELASGDVLPSDLYLSGNVREKLRQAKAAVAEGMTHLQRNVDALAAVVPADVPYFKIETQLGATWISPDVYGQFVAHMLALPDPKGVEVRYNAGRWSVRIDDRAKSRPEARTGFGTAEYGFQRLVNAAFSNQTVTIRRRDSEGGQYVDNAATEEVNGKISEMRTKFADWLWSDPERRVAVEAEYNEVRNAFATPKFDGSFLRFEGMALSLGEGPFDLRSHQRDAIWRGIVSRRSLNAHEVGTGKTFTMGGIAVESRRYGIARKPLILAHNANSKTVAAEIQMMYPAAKILYIDNLTPAVIDVKMRQIANDDWDAVVVPHSLIDRFAFKEETLMEMAREDIAALEEEAYAAAVEDGATIKDEMWDDPEELKKLRSPTAKELVKMRQRIIETIKKQSSRASREGAIAFEDLGIDMLQVDEAHEFKKPPISTRMKMKGLNTQTSDRSIALSFMTRYVRAQNNGGNVHLFTGTPVTNTLTEVFHMMRYIMQEEMQAAGIDQWDGWFGSFAREVMDVEQNAAAEYEAVTRLAGFINVPELRRMIGQYMDTVFADDMPEMQPRRTASGKTMADELTEAERAELLNGRTEGAQDRPYKRVINVTSDLTPQQKVIFEQLRGYARRWRSMTGKERKDAMASGAPESPIITEGLAAKASFDVRLYDGEALAGQEGTSFDDPGSKASNVVDNVKRIYDWHPQTTQVIFAEQGFSNRVTRSLGKDGEGNRQTRTFPSFSTIRDVVERLVASGISREQIAVVDGSTSKDKRKEIALKMNAAKIRVVIGSTATLGVGVNMQRNLRAMHHMDAPWMPGDLEQRNGRGQRQGNQWNTVEEYRYLTDRLDGRRWQVLAIKQRFITAFLKADDSTRVIEGEAAADEQSDILQSFAEAAGDPRILIREKLRKQLDGAQRRERLHTQGVANALSQSRRLTNLIADTRAELRAIEEKGTAATVGKIVADNTADGFSVTIDGKIHDKRKDADEAIQAWAAHNMHVGDEPKALGMFGGHDLTIYWPGTSADPQLRMEIDGEEFRGGSMQGLEKSLRRFGPDIERQRAGISESEASIERLRAVAAEPFHMAADLARYDKALSDLEVDIRTNPVPPPAWLRAGAPVDTEMFWHGKSFTVSGHRWNDSGWYVQAEDDGGTVSIPYMQAKDAQGIDLYEERPFEAPEVVEAKSVKQDAGVDADEPSAHSIGNLEGGGFTSTEGLAAHLADTGVGASIMPLIDAGSIVLHTTGATLPGAGLRSAQSRADTNAWSRAIDAIVRGDGVGRALVRLGKTPAVLKALGMPDGEIMMARAKVAKARREHPAVPLSVWKALPDLIADPRAVFPSRRDDGSLVIVIEGRDAQNDPIFVPVTASADGTTIVLSVYGKDDGDSVIAADLKRAASENRLHYVREGLADALVNPKGLPGAAPPHAPVASGVSTKPARKILSARDVVKKSSEQGAVQGMTTPDGRIHLVADRLTSRTALPVLFHEMFHAGVRPLVGDAAWQRLLGRLSTLYRSAALREATADRGNAAYWQQALARVEAAGPPLGQEVEEFAAYAIELRALAPAGVGEMVDRLLGGLKAWLLRRFGRQIGAVTPAQLQALAIAAIHSHTTVARPAGAGQTFYSRVVPPESVIDAVTPGFVHNLVTNAMDGSASILAAVPLRPLLAELAAPLPAAQEYLRLKQAMDQMRDSWHARADDVAQPWLKYRVLHRAENTALMDLMHEATLDGADPAEAFTSSITKLDRQILAEGAGTEAYEAAAAKVARDTSRQVAHDRLTPLFKALSPEAQRIYVQVRDSYKALSDAFEQILLDNLSKALDIKFRQAQRAFDTEMWDIANSGAADAERDDRVKAAEQELARAKQMQGWAKGARMTRMRAFFETNNLSGPYFPLARFGNFFVSVKSRDSGDVISFSRFEKTGPQQAFAAEMRKAGHDVEHGVLQDGGKLRNQVDARFIADIESILEGADVGDGVKDAVWQRWLETMPDMSVRTSRIHRKGRAGFTTDALRAFGNHMFHGSHQLARLKYALDLDEALALAGDQGKTMPDPVRAGLVVNEMARRHQFIMNPTGGALAQRVTSAAFVYFLSVSPAAALVNTAQTAVLGVPILAAYDGRPGRGAARASAELSKSLRDFALGRGHAGKAKALTDLERKAMEAAYETGLIERTQSHDLAGVGDSGVAYSPVRAKVMAAISVAFHHTERMNREVTFLAAYRMGTQKGLSHDMAIDKAAELTWKIHFDYQNTSRPRVMQSDTAKALLVFRNFNANMLWRLFRDAHQAVKGGTTSDRREALTQLAGTTGMMMLSAGVRGTWLYGIAIMLASLMFGDDAEDDFKRAVVDVLGHRLGGMALNGVPGDLLGIDLSNRIGMPDLWFRSPDREMEGATEFDYWAMQILGAGVGMLRNAWVGTSQALNGHVERGIETMSPKFAKDLMRATRYMTEGARTLQGDPIMEEMDASSAIKQALGFTPAELAERYERNRSMKNREQRILDERRGILNDMDAAVLADEDTTPIEERMAKFNDANPDYPITVRSIRQSMRSRAGMRERKIGGVALNPKLADRLNEEAPELLYSSDE
ncbi:PLxRFG domain-containing protein [Sphingobium sufflavum]|uniref:PLxRFG domain-containing protein n=1 Tax=Sphingobium sufflavum TaxID=1129547 RepID=UPI001F2BBEA8|nr:PLxRFG domain-containing protein [Sphingobium sufflavum]MCE7797848.1 PLxRFG domain-containing protein [Sphingobium sufflavum]